MPKRLAIITQDPSHAGGVLRLVQYIYRRAEHAGLVPDILHYGSFSEHPELHAAFTNLVRGELNLFPTEKDYEFHGMRARALGAWFPEWEPRRIHSNVLWRKALRDYSSAILVTGSAHTGLPLVKSNLPYAAWISATVADDRRQRLATDRSLAARFEKLGLPTILRAEKRVIEGAKKIISVSNDSQKKLQRITSKPIEVWSFPIDTEKFSPADTTPQSIRFLFVGRANDPRKRIHLFFESCSKLRSKRPQLDFSVTVISSPIEISVPFPVEWKSGISELELIETYRQSTVFALTSEQEGLGIAAMEAMSCGTPVISTRCGGPETFLEDGVGGFFADTSETIAERMVQLCEQSDLRARMGEAARNRIETDFSERVWNNRFESMIGQL